MVTMIVSQFRVKEVSTNMNKSIFKGIIISIQPRIRMTRSFDEASHTYLGYAIKLEGELNGEETTFSIGIGKQPMPNINSK